MPKFKSIGDLRLPTPLPASLTAIAALAREVPEITGGAGTRFAISPGASASEMQAAINAGYTLLKFFPAAGAGGTAAMKAFAAPFPQLRFCATGGVTAETAQTWLDLPNVVAVGGSWFAPSELIARHEWNAIEARARDAATCFKHQPAR